MAYEHTGHAVHLLNYHPVWTPKCRRSVLEGSSAECLHTLVGELAVLRRRLPTLRVRSYACGTAGTVSVATIQRYIAAQKGV